MSGYVNSDRRYRIVHTRRQREPITFRAKTDKAWAIYVASKILQSDYIVLQEFFQWTLYGNAPGLLARGLRRRDSKRLRADPTRQRTMLALSTTGAVALVDYDG